MIVINSQTQFNIDFNSCSFCHQLLTILAEPTLSIHARHLSEIKCNHTKNTYIEHSHVKVVSLNVSVGSFAFVLKGGNSIYYDRTLGTSKLATTQY